MIGLALALHATPADAAKPEGWSIIFGDAWGTMVDCFEFKRCTASGCRVRAVYTEASGKCTPIEDFAPGRTRLSCSFKHVRWSFWHPRYKEVILDVTCSRLGETDSAVKHKYASGTPLACSATATYRHYRYRPSTDSYVGLTLESPRGGGKPARCSTWIPGSFDRQQWERIRLQDLLLMDHPGDWPFP